MINLQWLELPMSRMSFHGPKDVRVIEVRLYMNLILTGLSFLDTLSIYCIKAALRSIESHWVLFISLRISVKCLKISIWNKQQSFKYIVGPEVGIFYKYESLFVYASMLIKRLTSGPKTEGDKRSKKKVTKDHLSMSSDPLVDRYSFRSSIDLDEQKGAL